MSFCKFRVKSVAMARSAEERTGLPTRPQAIEVKSVSRSDEQVTLVRTTVRVGEAVVDYLCMV